MALIGMVVWAASFAALATALGLAAAEDLARRVIPNGCVVAVAASGLAAALSRAAGGEAAAPAAALAGALATLSVMLAAALVSWRVRGAPGVGGGDIKLLAAVGVWLGPLWGLACVALSCAAALALWGAVLLVRRVAAVGAGHGRGAAAGADAGVPLAPGVAAATLGIVLLGLPWQA